MSKDNMHLLRFNLTKIVVLMSLGIQGGITILVLLFCMVSLRYETNEGHKAVLFSILTGTTGFWFPSPASQYIGTPDKTKKEVEEAENDGSMNHKS